MSYLLGRVIQWFSNKVTNRYNCSVCELTLSICFATFHSSYVGYHKTCNQSLSYTAVQSHMALNSLSASLLLNIFLSFEVGIAHAIANFK